MFRSQMATPSSGVFANNYSFERSLHTRTKLTTKTRKFSVALIVLTLTIRRCEQPIKLISLDVKHDQPNFTEG